MSSSNPTKEHIMANIIILENIFSLNIIEKYKMINPLNINTKPPSLGVFFLWNFIVLLGVSYNFRLVAIGSLKKYNKKNNE